MKDKPPGNSRPTYPFYRKSQFHTCTQTNWENLLVSSGNAVQTLITTAT